jgi:hypothetical protein
MNKERYMNTLSELLGKYPNDEDAGKAFRMGYMKINEVDLLAADNIVHRYPLDSELGAYIRSHSCMLLRKFR